MLRYLKTLQRKHKIVNLYKIYVRKGLKKKKNVYSKRKKLKAKGQKYAKRKKNKLRINLRFARRRRNSYKHYKCFKQSRYWLNSNIRDVL
jgi:hypothetical protein